MADQGSSPGEDAGAPSSSGEDTNAGGGPGGSSGGGVDLDQLKQDVAKLRDDFTQLIQSGAEAAREELGMRVERMRTAVGSVRAGSGRAVGAVSNTIEERPLAAVMVAFGVGLLVAKLLDR